MNRYHARDAANWPGRHTWVFISETVLDLYRKLCVNNVLNLGIPKNFSLMGLNEWHLGWYMICLKRYSLRTFFLFQGQIASSLTLIKLSQIQSWWVFLDSGFNRFTFFLLNSSCGWFETCYLINTITGSLLVAFFIYSLSLDNAI